MILLATAVTVSWPTLAAIAAAMIAVVKFGDRLWGRGKPNGGANGGPDLGTKVTRLETKLEEHTESTNRRLGEIRDQLNTISDRLFMLIRGSGE